MSEVYVFEEGSAYFWTGSSSTSALVAYVQNVKARLTITYTSYKPPHATTYTTYAIGSGAQLTIGELYNNATLGKIFNSATGGGIHVHLKHSVGGITQSGGIFLYSGYLPSYDISESPGAADIENLQGNFPTWSIY